MPALQHVNVEAMDPLRFESVLSGGEFESLRYLIADAARGLRGRVIWNVNSTANGGGVAEMLRPLLGYCRGLGVDARWAVISGNPEFFLITKRIHNRLHGFAGDGGPLGAAEHEVYDQTLVANAAELVELVHPEDVVILHDPQTAGLAQSVRQTGATVIWRCHVGLDNRERLRPWCMELPAWLRGRGSPIRVLARGIRMGGSAPREDHGDPSLDRRLLSEERGSERRAVAGDPLEGGHSPPVRHRRGDVHALGRHARPRRPPRDDRRGRAART